MASLVRPVGAVAAGRSNRIASLILVVAVAAAPLPYGSTAPAIVAVWCVILGVGLAMASPRALRATQLTPLAIIAVVVAGYLVVLHEQLANERWFAVAPHPIWDATAKLLHTTVEPSLTIARNEPLYALGTPLAAILAFATSYIVCADRYRAHQLLQVVAWSGACYALFGIAQFMLDPTGLLWREKTDYLASVTGTFVNRNTAGVYFGSCAVVCLLLFLKDLESHRHERKPHPGASSAAFNWGRFTPSPALVISFARVVILTCAMFMTKSRAGVVFSLLGLVVAFAIFRWREFNRRQSLWLSLGVGAAIALALLQSLGGAVGHRFDASGLSDVARIETYRSTLRMIADFPWLGTGLGTFGSGFPAYRGSGSVWGIWNRAHDTLLEIAAEVGLPLALLTVVAWCLIILILCYGIRIRRRDLIVPVAALSVAAISIAHSLIDFSLQIPGYAIVIFALLGAGISQSYPSHNRPADLR